MVAVLTAAFIQFDIALHPGKAFGTHTMHPLDLFLFQEVKIFNVLVFFCMVLEAVDALTTLLTLEVALLWIASLLSDDSILLHFAVWALESLRTGTLPIHIRCVVTA